MDQSKAYDRVPLDLLAELLRDSGVHPSIGGPMLCMARSRRRIKVLDAIGEARQPTSGLVPGCPMATFVEGLLMLRWRLFAGGPVPRLLGNAGQAPGGGQAPPRRKPRVLRCWVDDSTTGDIGTEASAVTVVRGLRGIELLTASDLLLVNCIKSAVAATPSDRRTALTTLIQGRFGWKHGGVLVLSEDEIEQELLHLIAERLGTGGEKVHVGGLEQLHWATAGKATVLVHLPGGGIPPITAAVVEAGGGVVLRGWPDAWPAGEKDRGALALREHQAWPRIAVPVVAALKDLGVVVGAGAQAKCQHQQRLLELFRRSSLVGRLGLPFGKRERLVASSAIPAGLHGCAAQPPDSDTLDAARRHVLFALHRGSRFCQMPLSSRSR